MAGATVKDWIEFLQKCNPDAYLYETNTVLYTQDVMKVLVISNHTGYYNFETTDNEEHNAIFVRGAQGGKEHSMTNILSQKSKEVFEIGKALFRNDEYSLDQQVEWILKHVEPFCKLDIFLIGSKWMFSDEFASKCSQFYSKQIQKIQEELFERYKNTKLYICRIDYQTVRNVLCNPIEFLKTSMITCGDDDVVVDEEKVVVIKSE